MDPSKTKHTVNVSYSSDTVFCCSPLFTKDKLVLIGINLLHNHVLSSKEVIYFLFSQSRMEPNGLKLTRLYMGVIFTKTKDFILENFKPSKLRK